jgi:signal transduction histidine kinase
MQSSNDTHSCNDANLGAALRIVTDGAHEIRSQLAVILLEVGKIDQTSARQIEADIQLASQTVNRVAILFKLATAEKLVTKPLDLSEVLRGLVTRTILDRPERLHQIEFLETGSSGFIDGQAGILTEALRGLLDNAARHTPVASRIVVNRAGDGIVTIDDDGPGLPQVVVSRFGEAFVHGRGPSAGAGLGLAIAHHAARLHGGRCFLAPSQLGGTCIGLDIGPPHIQSKQL